MRVGVITVRIVGESECVQVRIRVSVRVGV